MADTPVGLSFGDARKYIGSSGIGSAIKTGLTAYGMQQSGLTDWLNNLKKPQQPNIPGSVKPFTGISDQGQLPAVPQAPQGMDWGSMMPAAPVVPGAAPAAPTVMPETTPAQPNPSEIGFDWLSGKLSKLDQLKNSMGSGFFG